MITNYHTGKKEHPCNRNVPDGVKWIGYVSYCSGEIHYDYYCQEYNPPHPEYGGWALWKVADWVDSFPQPTNWEEIEKVIG